MSISYHGVVGHTAKVTLPSVQTWGSNMNILRDPPKSIMTRKIDKVGETSELTEMMQESGDRACESIMTYARGVNPMVAVSYNNYSNNAGQRVNGLQTGGTNTNESFLPYRIMDGGAFRPPARTAEELYPLSRLPRVWTSSFTKPGFADYSKRVINQCSDENTREVKNPGQILKGCVRPTTSYKINLAVQEPYEVQQVIKNPLIVEGYSGIKAQAVLGVEIGEVTQEIRDQPLHADSNTNKSSSNTKNVETSHMNTEKYIQDNLHATAEANRSQQGLQVTPIDQLLGLDTQRGTKDQININHDIHKTGYNKYDYIHGEIEKDRVLPYHEARTNTGQNIHKQNVTPIQERNYTINRPNTMANTNIGSMQYSSIDNISRRERNLRPTVNAGGYVPNAGRPMTYHENPLTEFDTHKSEMRKRIYEMQSGRYGESVN